VPTLTCPVALDDTLFPTSESYPAANPLGGWFVLLQLLILPPGHSLPIGLLLDPKLVSVTALKCLVPAVAKSDNTGLCDWLQ